MKNKILIFLLCSSSNVFAGVTTGGGGLGLTVGDTMVEASEFQITGKGALALDKARLLEVIAESMTSEKRMELNGEPLTAERYDFKSGRLSLRSLSDPSRVIIIEESSPE